MTASIEQRNSLIPALLIDQLVGAPVGHDLVSRALTLLQPARARELDTTVQATELYLIRDTADRIEGFFAQRELSLPTVYALHTAGFPVPFEGEVIGHCGQKGLFESLPPTDIYGHTGQVSVASINGRTYMAFEGRAHPYEWRNHPYGHLLLARPLQVVKELIRRQREAGENPIVVLTYLSGVCDDHILKPGDIGIILDDIELGESLHPGSGAHALLEPWLGPRFQQKAGRSSLDTLAVAFHQIAQEQHVPVGPVMIAGAPSTTEFEGWGDTGLALAAFDKAMAIGFGDYVKKVYPWTNPSLVFGMGNTFELAVMRQLQEQANPADKDDVTTETDIPVLALALITDSVGATGFATPHRQVVKAALAKAERNATLMSMFVKKVISGKINLPTISRLPDWAAPFSLQGAMWQAAQEQERQIAGKIFPEEEPVPQSVTDLTAGVEKRIRYAKALKRSYQAWGFPYFSNWFGNEVHEYKRLLASLGNDGQLAHQFYIRKRDEYLIAAQGAEERGKHTHLVPVETRAILTTERLEGRRKAHLRTALLYEQAARVVAEAKSLPYQPVDIDGTVPGLGVTTV